MSAQGLLILSESEYRNYLAEKKTVKPVEDAQQQTDRAHDTSDKLRRAESLLDKESEAEIKKQLSKLNLAYIDTPEAGKKLVPVNVKSVKFKSEKDIQLFVSKISDTTPKHVCRSFEPTPTQPPRKRLRHKASHKRLTLNSIPAEWIQPTLAPARLSVASESRNSITPEPSSPSPSSQMLKPSISDKFKTMASIYLDTPSHSRKASTAAPEELQSAEVSYRNIKVRTNSKPDKKTLKRYLSEVLLNLPDDSDSTQPSNRKPEPKPSKRRLTRRSKKKTVSCLESVRTSLSPPQETKVPYKDQSPRKKSVAEIKPWEAVDKKLTSKGVTGLGEVMEVMYNRKGVVQSEAVAEDMQKLPHLHTKIFEMLKSEPQEVHRIVESPHYISSRLKSQGMSDVDEWAEEHEAAYKTIMRKSTSFSTIAKTIRFKELAKDLPEKRTYLNEEWKYDPHSPWVNDLDYHSEEYFEVVNPSKKSRKNISNIRTSSPDFMVENKHYLELKRLQNELGRPNEKSLAKLKLEAKEQKKVNDFRDAMACFENLQNWEKSSYKFEKAKKNLTDYLIGKQLIEMKKLNLARYTYLSSKIASQRAKLELEKQIFNEAEEKRKVLRKRQKEFQRKVTIMRAVVRKKYGAMYNFKPRRVLKNTEAKIGSPCFIENMIKLGYLPKDLKPEPQRLNPGGQVAASHVNLALSPNSLKNLSKMNVNKRIKSDSHGKLTKHGAAEYIQAHIKGWLWRIKLKKMKKAATLFQKGYRRYKAWKYFIKFLIIQQLRQPTPRLRSLLFRFSRIAIFNKALKEVKESSLTGLNLGNLKRHPNQGNQSTGEQMTPMPPEDEPRVMSFPEVTTKKLPVIDITSFMYIYDDKPKKVNIPITVSCVDSEKEGFYDLDEYEKAKIAQEANEVNDLIRGITRARSEMWRIYLSAVTKAQFTDEDVLKVLTKSSLYASKSKGQRNQEIIWKDSFFQHPIFKSFNLALIKPEDLFGFESENVKAKLESELNYAHSALELAKEKYASTLVNMHQFDSAVITSVNDVNRIVIPRLLPESKHAQDLILETLKNKFDEVESLKTELTHLKTSGRFSPY
mmetsp:Transcript_24195/g.42997  ORF Transcript_24195/g.42997 Transcript_24195/m.42997 type:complete len:1076 (+) Transcript_24195:12-3239(+)